MAANVANYYLWRFGEPATFYEFEAYLQQFELEKEDSIRLTTDFTNINGLPLRIVDTTRFFGSGKNKTINTYKFYCESIRHTRIIQKLFDTVIVIDSFAIDTGASLSQADAVAIQELVLITQTTTASDSIISSDDFSIVAVFNNVPTESVTASEVFAVSMICVLGDSVSTIDFIVAGLASGFGTGGFGETGFGSPGYLDTAQQEVIQIEEEVIITLY